MVWVWALWILGGCILILILFRYRGLMPLRTSLRQLSAVYRGVDLGFFGSDFGYRAFGFRALDIGFRMLD